MAANRLRPGSNAHTNGLGGTRSHSSASSALLIALVWASVPRSSLGTSDDFYDADSIHVGFLGPMVDGVTGFVLKRMEEQGLPMIVAFALADMEFRDHFNNPPKRFVSGCPLLSQCNLSSEELEARRLPPALPIPDLHPHLENLTIHLIDEGAVLQSLNGYRRVVDHFATEHRASVVMGGMCWLESDKVYGKLFAAYDTLHLHFLLGNDDLGKKQQYPTVFRTITSHTMQGAAAWRYVVYFGWRGLHLAYSLHNSVDFMFEMISDLGAELGRPADLYVQPIDNANKEEEVFKSLAPITTSDIRLVLWAVVQGDSQYESVFSALNRLGITSPRYQFLSIEHTWATFDSATAHRWLSPNHVGWHAIAWQDQTQSEAGRRLQERYSLLTAEDIRDWLRLRGFADWVNEPQVAELEDAYFTTEPPSLLVYRTVEALHTLALAFNEMFHFNISRQQMHGDLLSAFLLGVTFESFADTIAFDVDWNVALVFDYLFLDFEREANNGTLWTVFGKFVEFEKLANDLKEFGAFSRVSFEGDDYGPVWASGSANWVAPPELRDCHAGTFLNTNSSRCVTCPDGHFSNTYDQTACEPCGVGTYTTDGITCAMCDPGRFARVGSAACSRCDPGEFAASVGQSSCERCPLGRAQSEEGRTACGLCHAGTVANNTGLSLCISCNQGTSSHTEGATTACQSCPGGTYAARSSSSECAKCEAGRYSGERASSCIPCPVGEFGNSTGSAACASCLWGSYSNATGQTQCLLCSEGRRGDPAAWTTMAEEAGSILPIRGATSAEACSCIEGWRQAGDGSCMQCEDGLICRGLESISVKEGYASEALISVFKCFSDPDRCVGGLPGAACAAGRRGQACAECVDGKTPGSDGTCTECEALNGYAGVAFAAVAVMCMLVFIYMMQGMKKVKAPSKQMLLLLFATVQVVMWAQQVSIIGLIEVGWDGPAKALFQFLSLISLNVDVVGTQCVTGTSAAAQYLVSTMLIFALAGFVCIVHVVYTLYVMQKQGKSWRSKTPQFIATIGTIFTALYISITSLVVQPVQCNRNPNDKWTVQKFQSVKCWDGDKQHTDMLIVGVIIFLLVPAAFLARVGHVTYQFPHRMRKLDTGFLQAHAFIFERFRPARFWYGCVFCTRNLLIALVPVLPTPALELVILEVIMMANLCCNFYFLPWRLFRLNMFESFLTAIAGFMALIAVSYVSPSKENKESMGYTFWVFAFLVLFCLLLAMIGALIRYCQPKKKRFQFFLCHHKAGAGAYVRLLKHHLATSSAGSHTSRVFIDSDDLDNLNRLFNYVSYETQNLVMVASKALFTRPWCLGEMTMARLRNINTVMLALPDCHLPTKEFIEDVEEQVAGMECLTESYIEVEMVQETLEWVYTVDRLETPGSVSVKAMDSVVKWLDSKSQASWAPWSIAATVSTRMSNGDGAQQTFIHEHDPYAEHGIILDETNLEAAATAHVLVAMITPRLVFAGKHKIVPAILSGSELPATLQTALALCTNGILNAGSGFLKMSSSAYEKQVKMLPVVAEPSFRFPSKTDLEPLDSHLLADGFTTFGDVVRLLFKEIGLLFQASMLSEKALRSQGDDIAGRWIGMLAGASKGGSTQYAAGNGPNGASVRALSSGGRASSMSGTASGQLGQPADASAPLADPVDVVLHGSSDDDFLELNNFEC